MDHICCFAEMMHHKLPVYTLLFDLYHSLQTNVHFSFVLILSEPGLISAGFQWTGSTPAGFQEAFRAVLLCGDDGFKDDYTFAGLILSLC